jgi:hypothetical protein
VLAALARLLPGRRLRRLCLVVAPRTVLRWHADLVRRHWSYPRRTLLGARVIYENPVTCFMTFDEEHHRLALVALPPGATAAPSRLERRSQRTTTGRAEPACPAALGPFSTRLRTPPAAACGARQRLPEMILVGRRIAAAEGLAYGLVN